MLGCFCELRDVWELIQDMKRVESGGEMRWCGDLVIPRWRLLYLPDSLSCKR